MIFDGHADIWTDITNRRLNDKEENSFRKYHYPKFKKGGVSGGIFVIWVDPPHDDNPVERADDIVKCMSLEIEATQDIIKIVKNYEDFKSVSDGKIKVIIGMEGMSQIGCELKEIEKYYDLGVRHASLTWNEENALATGAGGRSDRGLTELGNKAVKIIEDLGIVIDVSHLNDKSFWDVVKISKKPIIASHSNSRAICNNRRNLTDEQIIAIANTGGLIGINSFRDFVSEDVKEQNIVYLIKHIDYIKNLVGIDHLAYGFDFCDFIQNDTLSSFSTDSDLAPGIDGLDSVTEVEKLNEILLSKGYSKEELEKISFLNYDRVFKEILK